MSKIVFDIETVGVDFEDLDEGSQEYFLRFADTPQKQEDAKNSLSFYPVTAQVVTIGMLDVDTDKAFVFFQNNGKQEKFTEGNATYVSGDEKEILINFWKLIGKADTFITFNGRMFDCPFIMLRSAINSVRATKDLMPYRYGKGPHVDLYDQLTFYGAATRKFSLDMWCKAFSIKSPKAEGITGLQVKGLFKEGKYADIAKYCARDLKATKQLYFYWESFLKF
ncbi:MAG: ribonuclease H-like domain-containing protein [Candidatus Aceula meridiana]|nr:ribonuclease H-like domain-containing protein [Candidatus Aceula meridiana]